jgi:DNA-binding NarL/FixJ family response regulator
MDPTKTTMAIQVLVADDHPLIAQGLVSELKRFGIDHVDTVMDGTEVFRRFSELSPDVLVLDLRIGAVRGLDVAHQLLTSHPEARIVFYSQFDQDHIVREAYRIGGKAFIPKNADPSLLAQAIKTAQRGGTYFMPDIAERLALMSVRGDDSPQAKLGERELVVFRKMARGLTNAEIAHDLDLSVKTIGLTTQNIRETLGVSRAADITRLALKHQLIEE